MAKASVRANVKASMEIEEVLRFHRPVLGNLVRIEKMDNDRYLIITDKLTGTVQEINGFYYIAYVTSATDDGSINAIGLIVVTKRTVARMIQTHSPRVESWEADIKQKTGTELEEDLLQTYSAFRFLQRTR